MVLTEFCRDPDRVREEPEIYKKAMSMYGNGQYERKPPQRFTELGDYEDSQDMVMACNYEAAKVLF